MTLYQLSQKSTSLFSTAKPTHTCRYEKPVLLSNQLWIDRFQKNNLRIIRINGRRGVKPVADLGVVFLVHVNHPFDTYHSPPADLPTSRSSLAGHKTEFSRTLLSLAGHPPFPPPPPQYCLSNKLSCELKDGWGDWNHYQSGSIDIKKK